MSHTEFSTRHVLRKAYWHTLKCLAVALAVVYAGWNVVWFSYGQIPPSIFKSLTGLPCPTTGGTRSILALCRGELVESIRFNAMALPILVLFAATVIYPLVECWRRRRPAIPNWLACSWLVTLVVAWLTKLLGNPQYW